MKLSVSITVTHTVLDGSVNNIPVRYSSKDEISVLPGSNFSYLVPKNEKFHEM